MFGLHFTLLWTDIVIYLSVFAVGWVLYSIRYADAHISIWPKLLVSRTAVVTGTILLGYVLIALLDSLHFQYGNNGQVYSFLDVLFYKVSLMTETTYSAPFATHLFVKETLIDDAGMMSRTFKSLVHGHEHIKQLNLPIVVDVLLISLQTVLMIGLGGVLIYTLFVKRFARQHTLSFSKGWKVYLTHCTMPQKLFFLTGIILISLLLMSLMLSRHYHVLGTDKIGQDVLYLTFKSVRTGLVIGCLTLMIMLPIATVLGTAAGYYGRRVDDAIQYFYTVVSAIPAVLLIASAVLSLQIYLANHPEQLTSIMARADLRLGALCLILGLSGWPGLCRILRAETLKLRELDFIAAAKILNVPSMNIIVKHIWPNVFHLILISLILDFSLLVLAEAVLSYVGVGVDPTTMSWGNMINSARLEFARIPTVWWPLFAAFVGMFVLVLSVNLFANCLREAHDPTH